MKEKPSVLYVDDESINLLLFRRIYKEEYNIITASSGFEGLEILNSERDIRVVISDMKMPGMNGLEFVRTARKGFPDIAYFIFTGFDCTPEITEAIEDKSIVKYFCKPLNSKEINKSINDSLK
jgi:two-component system, response regulator, stage 0 sporulation protein F